MVGSWQTGHRSALVTGASSGIGLHIAKELARRNYQLILVATRQSVLEEIAKDLHSEFHVAVWPVVQDLSESGAAKKLKAKLDEKKVNVDYLVNNAGLGVHGLFHEVDSAKTKNLIQVNLIAPTELMHEFVPEMVKRRMGGVLNVCSIAAFSPGPLLATYFASKSYLYNLSLATHHELKPFKVGVTALCPGPVITEFGKRAQMAEAPQYHSPAVMKVERVAQIAVESMLKNKRSVIPGLINRILVFLGSFTPMTMKIKVSQSLVKI